MLGLGLCQHCSWAPLWAEIPQGAPELGGIGITIVGGGGRSPLKVLRMLKVKLHCHCPPSWPQVVCPYVLASNLMLTQPWDYFLHATTAATCFLLFWDAWGWYHHYIKTFIFLGSLGILMHSRNTFQGPTVGQWIKSSLLTFNLKWNVFGSCCCEVLPGWGLSPLSNNIPIRINARCK